MAAKKKTRKKSSSRKGAKRKTGKGKKRSTARKSKARKPARRAKRRSSGAKRKPNAAFMKPMTPSSQLSSVVGTSAIPRTEVTKRLWAYIKRKGLQDTRNRRMINADDNLRPIFGGRRQVSMFEMTRMVNQHLR